MILGSNRSRLSDPLSAISRILNSNSGTTQGINKPRRYGPVQSQTEWQTCPLCGGTGKVPKTALFGSGLSGPLG